MAIIYTYPSKIDPVADDKVLISDSEDNNKTKSVTIKDIRSGTVSGVSSILAGNNVTISPGAGTGDVTINATAYTAGDGIDINSYVVSADVKANSGIVIDSTELSLDLSASSITGTLGVADGGTGATTFTAGFLKANGTSAFSTVATISLTSEVADSLPIANGGTGQSAYSSGDMLYAGSSSTSLEKLTIGSSGQVLRVSSSGIPEWGNTPGTGTVTSVGFSTGTTGLTVSSNTTNPITSNGTFTISGVLSHTNGGTGLNTLGAVGQVLKVTNSGPAWKNRDGEFITLISANTIAWDYKTGSTAYLELGNNADVISINNLSDGAQGVLILDGTNNTSVTLPSSNTTPVITSKIINGNNGYTASSNIDVLRFVYKADGQTFYWTVDANLVTYQP